MENLIIYCNPKPSGLLYDLFFSVMKKIKDKGLSAATHDLYKENFPPILDQEEILRGISWDPLIRKHQEELQSCRRLIIIYPDWWAMPPAILKGWMDRILAPEIAYRWKGEDFLPKEWEPLLEGKEAHIIISSDNKLNMESASALWDSHGLGKCAMKVRIHGIDQLRSSDRKGLLIEQTIERLGL